MKPKVLNFGSLNIDMVYCTDHLVAPGETLASESIEVFSGGKGLNQSIALSRAEVDVLHVGKIGKDREMLIELLKSNGINTEFIQKADERTGHAIIQLSKDGQNSIILDKGANHTFTPQYIDEVFQTVDNVDMVLMQNEINLVPYIIESAARKNIPVALNPSPYNSALEEVDLSLVSVFLLNEVEGRQISGKENPKEILQYISQAFPKAKIFLTVGEDGSFMQNKGQYSHQPIYPVSVVDTTAAGDTYTGYALSGLLYQKTDQEILKLASKASSLAVSVKGAANSIPYMDKVLKLME